jgi:hypothetical protein
MAGTAQHHSCSRTGLFYAIFKVTQAHKVSEVLNLPPACHELLPKMLVGTEEYRNVDIHNIHQLLHLAE